MTEPGDQDLIQGRHFHDLRRWDLAARYLRAGLARSPLSAEDHAYLARALINLDRRVEAKAESDESMRLGPSSHAVLSARIDVLHGVGDRSGALDAARALVSLAPWSASARAELAFALYRKGRPRAALKVADEALALDPTDIGALNARAVALGALLRPEEAEAMLHDALAESPEASNLHNNLGLMQLRQGQISMAQESMSEALRLDATSAAKARNLKRSGNPIVVLGAILLGAFLRGIHRWGRWPAGVQVGLVVGLTFGGVAWTGAPAAAVIILLWSVVGWIERFAPDLSARIGRSLERVPLGMVSLPILGLYWVFQLARIGGPIAGLGAFAGFLLPFVLGRRTRDERTRGETGEAPSGPHVALRSRRRPNLVGGALTVVGGIAAAIGTALPWVRLESTDGQPYDLTGLGGELGMAIGVVGILVTAMGLARLPSRGQAGWRRGAAIAGGCALLTVGAQAVWLGIQWIMGTPVPSQVWLGPGLHLVFVAGVLTTIGGFVGGATESGPARRAERSTTRLGPEVRSA